MKNIRARIAVMMSLAVASSFAYAALVRPTLSLSDDARSIVVTVPAGALTSMHLELAYDNSLDGASMHVRSDADTRAAWAHARTLSASLPATGATFRVPLAELGVSADASFRLFASSADFALLDYVDQSGVNSTHDTGIKDSDCHALALGQYSKAFPTTLKYPVIIGSRQPSSRAGFALQHNGSLQSVHFMQRVNNKYTYRTLDVDSSKMNAYVFTNKVYSCNGVAYDTPSEGEKTTWMTPLGETGLTLHMGRFPEGDVEFKLDSRWYYLKLFGADGVTLLDYVPAKRKSDGVAGFYDRAAMKFVTPSDGGAFSGGSVTNDAFTVAAIAVSELCSFPRLARVPAAITLDTSNGATLSIDVRAGYGAGSKLYLANDTADKGDDIADWAEKLEVCTAIPAAGGTFEVDLAAHGLHFGRVFRVFIATRYTPLERVQLDSDDDVIDTGLADTISCGFEMKAFCTGFSRNAYAALWGTGEGNIEARSGFRVCLGGSKTKVMFGQFVNREYTYRFVSFRENEQNVLRVENDTLTLNGANCGKPESGNKDSWRTSPLGLSGRTAYIGRLPTVDPTGLSTYGWWYGLKIMDADGRLLLDYIPAQRADGTVGFLDRVRACFVTPIDPNGALVAGEATGDEAFHSMPLSATMTCDDQIPVAATWIGGASGALDLAANWACTNFHGAPLPATTLPIADVTDVVIAGAVAFNYTSATDRVWRHVAFRDCTLTDACDWRAFGDGFTLEGTIDLAGHALTLAGVPSGGTITSAHSGAPVALRLVVPSGVTNENVDCAITGNIRLVKEGAGLFISTKYPQTYAGGTDIVAGTLKAGVSGNINREDYGSYFGSLKTLDVRVGATLDAGGTYYWGHHTINLHGGTLTTSVVPSQYKFNPKIYLTTNSIIKVTNSCDLHGVLNLCGYTLHVNFENKAWMIFASSATNGTIVARGSGVFNFDHNATIDCPTVAFDLETSINVRRTTVIVRDLTVRGSEATYGGDHLIKVMGRLTPVTQNFLRVQLQDGATLDLSGREGTWPVESLIDGCSLSFAPDATVTVVIGERVRVPSRLVSWLTPPAGADTLRVSCDRADLKLEVKAEGLFVRRGLLLIVR